MIAHATAAADPSGAFLQYGVVGALCLILLGAVSYVYRQQTADLKARAEAAEARADRAEAALAALNATVQQQAMRALEDATSAVTDLLRRKRTT